MRTGGKKAGARCCAVTLSSCATPIWQQKAQVIIQSLPFGSTIKMMKLLILFCDSTNFFWEIENKIQNIKMTHSWSPRMALVKVTQQRWRPWLKWLEMILTDSFFEVVGDTFEVDLVYCALQQDWGRGRGRHWLAARNHSHIIALPLPWEGGVRRERRQEEKVEKEKERQLKDLRLWGRQGSLLGVGLLCLATARVTSLAVAV